MYRVLYLVKKLVYVSLTLIIYMSDRQVSAQSIHTHQRVLLAISFSLRSGSTSHGLMETSRRHCLPCCNQDTDT